VSLSQGDGYSSCSGAVELGILLPHLARVIVEGVTVGAGLLLVMARVHAPDAACPKCGTTSGRVHSRYSGTLADAAIGVRQVEIRLAVRRFFCSAPRLQANDVRRAGRRPDQPVRAEDPAADRGAGSIAVALARRAGTRLAGGLGIPASRQVMLRLVMATPDPEAASPRVLGVDDFAIRRPDIRRHAHPAHRPGPPAVDRPPPVTRACPASRRSPGAWNKTSTPSPAA
jgi:hypothetical protein